jgi:hypothetical protein
MSSTMRFIGGARLNFFNATWPLATLWLDENRLRLRAMSADYELRKDQIQAIELGCGVLRDGLKIVPSSIAAPDVMIFWPLPFQMRKISALAAELGYVVVDEWGRGV